MPDKRRFDIFVIEEGGEGQKSYWRNVGVGFENKDGSVNLKLYMFPALQIQMREHSDKK